MTPSTKWSGPHPFKVKMLGSSPTGVIKAMVKMRLTSS